jgi:periplasmic protein TonB
MVQAQPVDPIDRVTNLGGSFRTLAIILAVAAGLHVGVWFQGVVALAANMAFVDWMGGFRAHLRERILAEYEVDVVKEPEPPKEEEKVKEPEPEPEPVKPAAVVPKDAPPPAAAQAGQILAAKEDPNAPVDMTNTFVQGTGDNYAGGSTMAKGTATAAVRATAPAATGVPGGTGAPQAPVAGPDRTRPLRLRGGRDWSCPFPSEADIDQIDSASVDVEVSARADGSIESARVTRDPGHGFGREARACAMRQSFEAALDRDGNPVAARKAFRITFNR